MGGQIPTFDGLKRKKSLSTDLLLIKLHLRPFFGAMLLTAISREALTRYIDARMASTVIRCGRSLKRPCAAARYRMGFHCFGACYAREDYKILVPSFEALVVRTERGGRALTENE